MESVPFAFREGSLTSNGGVTRHTRIVRIVLEDACLFLTMRTTCMAFLKKGVEQNRPLSTLPLNDVSVCLSVLGLYARVLSRLLRARA